MTIAIIDYGMGNLKSVAKAFEHVGATVCVTRDANEIKNASKIVLPGVGAFGQCVGNLVQCDLDGLVKEEIRLGKFFLGICLGLQLLFEGSAESPGVSGLGLIDGEVKRFDHNGLKVPHMGWNCINSRERHASPLLDGLVENPSFYFVHSYYVCPKDPSVVAATTDYGVSFCSAVARDNVFACQFHPEKSQANGLKIVENFVKL